MNARIMILGMLGVTLAGCAIAPTATVVSAGYGTPLPAIDVEDPALKSLTWLRESPFEPAPDSRPVFLTSDLFEGFVAQKPEYGSGGWEDDLTVDIATIVYKRPVIGQVGKETSVTVQIFAYSDAEARSYHLDQFDLEDYDWSFEEIDGHRVVAYRNGLDGRIWVSGPYLILVYSGRGASDRAPWVEAFTEMYLNNPPGLQ